MKLKLVKKRKKKNNVYLLLRNVPENKENLYNRTANVSSHTDKRFVILIDSLMTVNKNTISQAIVNSQVIS